MAVNAVKKIDRSYHEQPMNSCEIFELGFTLSFLFSRQGLDKHESVAINSQPHLLRCVEFLVVAQVREVLLSTGRRVPKICSDKNQIIIILAELLESVTSNGAHFCG